MKGGQMMPRARVVLLPLLSVATIASFLVSLSVVASAPPAAAVPPSPSPNADISVAKSVACSVAGCPADTDVTYTITASNGGPEDMTKTVTLTDEIPTETDFVAIASMTAGTALVTTPAAHTARSPARRRR